MTPEDHSWLTQHGVSKIDVLRSQANTELSKLRAQVKATPETVRQIYLELAGPYHLSNTMRLLLKIEEEFNEKLSYDPRQDPEFDLKRDDPEAYELLNALNDKEAYFSRDLVESRDPVYISFLHEKATETLSPIFDKYQSHVTSARSWEKEANGLVNQQ